ncbi:hypothetical protein [Zunongwangia sp.]|uniref:hypothetical protein n=1 Tax=Zunongwangia sp. TaxID=1965325 RepID=UPI003AA953FF
MIKKVLLLAIAFSLISCSAFLDLDTSNMNKLQLGMTKEEVIEILGKDYAIAEKRKENGNEIEILSYQEYFKDNKYYLFKFNNGKLENWHREIIPEYEIKK